MITAMILAGGTGSRVGAACPKQYVKVLGKPILAYTVEIFQEHTAIDTIEVVSHPDWCNYVKEMAGQYGLTKVKWVVPGGETFQESVMNGVNGLKDRIRGDDYVLIQYGAAPFTSERIVSDVIRVMKEKGSAVTATPCYQLMGSNDGEESRRWVDRDKYIQIACPYGFRYSYLLDIYQRAEELGLIGRVEPHTTSLMYALGDCLYQAYGDQTNIKITTKEDIELFEGYVLMQRKKKNIFT
ncbi:2-C-methyl-D-erythritol 4-phosphate cytidylyltransferase [bacterium 1XD42-94]|nr:2-C-methyl-D-erythritol 4-phosphate cytidylyltransferase [bacterium 1XD42-76]NBK05490.1 2-C-methyl-D-erythritol 4-phosphate cytidylyltransferase [bacterium 1XD42-94]